MREQLHTLDMLNRVEKALQTAEENIHQNMKSMSTQQYEAAKRSILDARAEYEGATNHYHIQIK